MTLGHGKYGWGYVSMAAVQVLVGLAHTIASLLVGRYAFYESAFDVLFQSLYYFTVYRLGLDFTFRV